jgi:hypothetical protein
VGSGSGCKLVGTVLFALGCTIVLLGVLFGICGLGSDEVSGPVMVTSAGVVLGGVIAYGGWRLRRACESS